jgi:hypothetical protein
MGRSIMQQVLALGIRQKLVLAAATLLTAFVIGGWALASGWVTSAAAVGEPSSVEMIRSNDANKLPLGDIKPNLVGSYRVTGTATRTASLMPGLASWIFRSHHRAPSNSTGTTARISG